MNACREPILFLFRQWISSVYCFSKFSITYKILNIVKENNKIVRRFSVTANRSGALMRIQANNRDVKFEGILNITI